MPKDCKFCFYYTWEQELLCAVEPELSKNSRNACTCKNYDYNPNTKKITQVFWLPAFIFVLAVANCVVFVNNSTKPNDPNELLDSYELSAPASVQHIRED